MPNREEVVIAWTTIPAEMDSRKFVAELLKDHLAACVSTFQKVQSTYRWCGKIESAEEYAMMIKTTRTRVVSLKNRILELHTHDVPEFVVTTVSGGHGPYLDWVQQETFAPPDLNNTDD